MPTEAANIKTRDAWISRGVNLLAAGIGAIAASVLHEGTIPTETLDWILKNGLQGGALVGCVVLGTAYAVEKRSLRKVLDERFAKSEDEREKDRQRAEKMEQLYLAQLQDVKEQRKVVQRSREAHEASNEVLKEIAGEDVT